MRTSVSDLTGFSVSTDHESLHTYLVCTRRNPETYRMCTFEEDVEDFPLVTVASLALDHSTRYHK